MVGCSFVRFVGCCCGCLASPVGDVVCSRFVVDLVWLAGCFGSLICLCTLWCVLLRSGF